jgi:hypothetical protein
MARPLPLPEKVRWTILVAGLTASIPFYAVVVFFVLSTPGAPVDPASTVLRFAFYGAAFLSSWVALLVAPRVGTDPAKALGFEAFLRRTIFSLALAEVSAILGLVLFFLGRNLGDFLVLAGLAIAVIVLGIVPRGLRWFRLREHPATAAAPPLGPG